MITLVCDTPSEAADVAELVEQGLDVTTDYVVMAGGRILYRRKDGKSAP